jgi:hypothetical protein
LERDRPVLFTEFAPRALEQVSRIDPERFIDALIALGYVVFALTPGAPPRPVEGGGVALVQTCRRLKTDHMNLMLMP